MCHGYVAGHRGIAVEGVATPLIPGLTRLSHARSNVPAYRYDFKVQLSVRGSSRRLGGHL